MRLTHRHIEVFHALMVTGSVTKAAELLCTSQPTVSRELARIEQVSKVILFERAHGRLRPTLSAHTLFEEVKRFYAGLDRVSSLITNLREQRSGQLSLIALPAFSHSILPGACQRFKVKAPGAGISITVQEAPFLDAWLTAQQFDLGLTEHDLAPPGTQLQHLLEVDEVCVLPAGHPLLEKRIIDMMDFEDQPFISLSPSDPYRVKLDTEFSLRGVRRIHVVETPTAVSLCSLVRKGLGVGIVNPLTALDFTGPDLHIRPLAISCPFCISIVSPVHRPVNPLTDSFVEALRGEATHIEERLHAYCRASR